MTELLPKDRRIIESGNQMKFRPFGKDETGRDISDITGLSISVNVSVLEELVSQKEGPEAGKRAVEKLVALLNDRIPDPAYQVSSEVLRKWGGYSNEFVAYLVEFCIDLSNDPDFQQHVGKKMIPGFLRVAWRLCTVKFIYGMAWIHIQNYYAKNSYTIETVDIKRKLAVFRMRLTERTKEQFGPYRKACGKVWCHAIKFGIASVPEAVHSLLPAKVVDNSCIAEGDEYCEWKVTWEEPRRLWNPKDWARVILQSELKEKQLEDKRFDELQKAHAHIQQLNVRLEAKVKERTAELETANERLQELDRLKTEFFNNINHELRTPLTLSLDAFNSLLTVSPSPESQELIQTGLRNTSRLLFLINELLDLAKIDSGRLTLHKQCIDLSELVREVSANFESSEKRRVNFRWMTGPVPIEVDPRQMKKVLYNLFSNGLKFNDPQMAQVWVRIKPKESEVELEVEDNGIGIPQDQLDRIFDRFTQVEGDATRKFEGSGIGLALVKEIVTLHGGTVAVASELGQGSTFTISLPRGEARPENIVRLDHIEPFIAPVIQETHQPPTPSNELSPESREDLPLLVVADDNADMRKYLKRVLGKHYRIVLAKDGEEALEKAKNVRPDLILTDAMMPRMSGYDLLRAVRKDETLRPTPVIFLTARAGSEARIESLEAGADDYISKPFDEQEALARVKNLIRVRVQERELAELQKEKLARFLPPHVAELVLSGDAEEFLRGHRKEITVLFIDLRGFTAFAETAAPEVLLAVLQEYQKDMGQLVSNFGGTLERFSGDAIMVFFNDPLPVPNHFTQAVRMAFAMRDRVAELCVGWRKRGIELGAGIGLATGYATLGIVGFEKRMDYAAIGPVTNLAARLCGEARNGQILVSEGALYLVEDLVSIELVGPLKLKGFYQPVVTYNLTELRTKSPKD